MSPTEYGMNSIYNLFTGRQKKKKEFGYIRGLWLEIAERVFQAVLHILIKLGLSRAT